MIEFTSLGLAEPLLRAVSDEGYTDPTPIQAQVIPAMLEGRDIIGIAQTGTGKTASFVLPILNRINEQRGKPAPKTCRALILAPTRELAAQIVDSIRTYGRHMRVSVALVVGGARPGPQIRAIASGIDILVGTPGRLLDHISTHSLRLDSTQTVVLDEGDQMLDLGFMPAIRKIMARLPAERQTVLLSATMPQAIRALSQDFLTNPAEIAVTPVSRPIERIEQKVIHLDGGEKRDALIGILKTDDMERAIVFTRTKRGADRVHEHLEKSGLASAAIHGNKSQGQRERAMAAFRNGSVKILVATDIAARGIDVDDISHVVNFELPNVPEIYVHRIGRTARAGKSGYAVSLCDASERLFLRDIERLTGTPLEILGEPPRGPAQPSPKPGQREGRRPDSRRSDGRRPDSRRHEERGERYKSERNGSERNGGERNGGERNGGERHGQRSKPRDEQRQEQRSAPAGQGRPSGERNGQGRTAQRPASERHGAPRDGAKREGGNRDGGNGSRNRQGQSRKGGNGSHTHGNKPHHREAKPGDEATNAGLTRVLR